MATCVLLFVQSEATHLKHITYSGAEGWNGDRQDGQRKKDVKRKSLKEERAKRLLWEIKEGDSDPLVSCLIQNQAV